MPALSWAFSWNLWVLLFFLRIRRINQYREVIGHYHTAGNPGRAELDDKQEINYPGVMRAILNTGYDGYVAQEFIPTWEDKALALRHAAEICDV